MLLTDETCMTANSQTDLISNVTQVTSDQSDKIVIYESNRLCFLFWY